MGYDIWTETGYDRDGTQLFQYTWDGKYEKDNTAAWRLMNDLAMANYTITHTDRNTIELRRLDPERICQRLVFSRTEPILFSDRPDGWVDPTIRAWPQD